MQLLLVWMESVFARVTQCSPVVFDEATFVETSDCGNFSCQPWDIPQAPIINERSELLVRAINHGVFGATIRI